MSGLVLTLAVDRATPGKAIGIKKAIAMDMEKYGDVRVLRVEVQEPEQLLGREAAPGLSRALCGPRLGMGFAQNKKEV